MKNGDLEPEIIGKDRDSYGRSVKETSSNFHSYSSSNKLKEKNSNLSAIEMNSTKALDTVKDHLKKAIGHTYFEVNELSNERLNEDKWAVEVEIDYLFRDKTEEKRFEIKRGVITSVNNLSTE